MERPKRDYMAEVRAAMRGRPEPLTPAPDPFRPGGFDDWAPTADDLSIGPLPVTGVPAPRAEANPTDAPITSGLAPDDVPYFGGDELNDEDALSDEEIYNLVIQNLSPEDRTRFQEAWNAMTPVEQAELIAGFRDNLRPIGP